MAGPVSGPLSDPSPGARISVIVPTYRRPALLTRCLDALAAQDLPAEQFEVVVVDDGSGPDTVAVLERAAGSMPNLRFASQPANRGPAAARNRAVESSSGALLLFLDDDIVASPSLVRIHLEEHDGAPPTRAVVGLVEWLPSLEVTPFMRWLHQIPLQFAYATMREGLQTDPFRAFYTCNLSMSAAEFGAVGGFDERFPYPAYEDIELAVRLNERGLELHFQPGALGYHSRAITLAEFCDRMRKVGQSAGVLEQAHPGLDGVLHDLAVRRHSKSTTMLLGLAAPLLPGSLGRRARSSYYWERVRQAYVEGLDRRGQPRPSAIR